jgi:SAM-dependent methyltransferase
MAQTYESADAEFRYTILDALPREPGVTLLDVGCDDGSWTERVRTAIGVAPSQVAGVEIVPERCRLAVERGFDARVADIDARWPFPDGSFDVVHSNQVIEHVVHLDHFVDEARRVLRHGGVAVVCTENLASWHNVAALALGLTPFSLTNVSRRGPLGNPFALHADEAPHHESSWQHVHVLTTVGLRSLFEMHELEVRRVFAAGYYPAVGKVASRLAALDPRHAHFIGVVARKR